MREPRSDTWTTLNKSWAYAIRLPAVLEGAGLAALAYTQLSGLKEEDNGLIAYDRRIENTPAGVVASINDELRAVFARASIHPKERS